MGTPPKASASLRLRTFSPATGHMKLAMAKRGAAQAANAAIALLP
jgi:hypothetical protein